MAESTSLNATSAPIDDKTSSRASNEMSVPISPGSKKGKRRSPGGGNMINDGENDSTTRLLRLLATQLEYYFSDHNLSRDTYLRTIMSLNSGYVPSTVLATFAKVNLLLNRYDTNHQALDRYGDVPGLVGEAARRSTLLDVAIINSEGKVVDNEKNGGSETVSGGVRLVAVGIKQGVKIPVAAAVEGGSMSSIPGSSPPKITYSGVPSTSEGSLSYVSESTQQNVERSTIILRDMPEGTVEDDVRSIFSSLEKAPELHSIHVDVGNCWFVALEPTPKDELVNILMALRNKKCKGEPIKPRLKTESSVKSYYTSTAPGTAPVPAPVSQSPVVTRPPYNKSNTGGQRGPPGGGRRYGGGTPQSYQSDKAPVADRAGEQRPSGGRGHVGGPGERGAGRGPHGGKSRGSGKGGAVAGSGGEAASQSPHKPKKVVESVPPPSLNCGSAFPTLGGDKAAAAIAGATKDTVNASPAEKKDEEGASGNTEVADDGASSQTSNSSGDKVVAVVEAKKPAAVAGYAAALLKAAPPRPITPPTPIKVATQRNGGSVQSKKGNSSKDQKGGKAVSRKLPAAPPVDDTSSAGERSAGDRSASSKTDSEKSATVAVVAPTWGGGKTFADILKKKEAEKTSAQS
uniref:HTH La-type RNA-binding domain-containing protein n=1 Tax=Ditylum brightwellii TaxID=49249 RepID=A0A7S1ZCL6_9STRA|mmetsp:Transcript_29181/g.43382  ORF Transcript_29181/g.43382 Transcript_29181/m.43382 type:complete len:629 (+) Transcript_29181:433-2319(+)